MNERQEHMRLILHAYRCLYNGNVTEENQKELSKDLESVWRFLDQEQNAIDRFFVQTSDADI